VTSIIGRYASRSLLTHLTMTLTGFVALLQLLDLLNNADDIIARHGNRIAALAKYVGLRLPDLTSFILPFAVLIAALLTLAKLARDNEILALKAAGLSFYRLLLTLVPIALIVGGLHFLLSDQVVPRTAHALQAWDANAESDIMGASGNAAPQTTTAPAGTAPAQPARAATQPGVWVRDGNSFIHIDSVLAEGTEIRGVTIFERGANYVLERRVMAKRAVYSDKHWRLVDAQVLEFGAGQSRKPTRYFELPWQISLTPNHLADLAADPTTLSLTEVWRFAARPDVGSRPVDFYRTWLQRKIAVPLTTLLMILLAAPVAQGLQRHGGIGAGLAAGVGLGFLYFVAEGLLLTLGETGVIGPTVAAWAPMAVFAAVGIASLLRIEGY
jgi:lipopolysaccharide export system permease protein